VKSRAGVLKCEQIAFAKNKKIAGDRWAPAIFETNLQNSDWRSVGGEFMPRGCGGETTNASRFSTFALRFPDL
jgi:hypothetical protein